VDKNRVSKIVFENGEEMEFTDSFNSQEHYLDNNKNAIKIDFLSPLTGNTTIAYEYSIQPGRSYEITVGLIGLGFDPGELKARGLFFKGGMKFIKTPDFYLRGMRYSHILKGAYAKPELAFGFYSKEFNTSESWFGSKMERESVITGAIFMNFGKQWVFDNSFLVDMYFGLGYGFDSGPNDGDYHYGWLLNSSNFPIAVQAGFKIGFLFK